MSKERTIYTICESNNGDMNGWIEAFHTKHQAYDAVLAAACEAWHYEFEGVGSDAADSAIASVVRTVREARLAEYATIDVNAVHVCYRITATTIVI